MKIGVFVPIGNNGWLISTHAPQYMPTFELNKAIVQKAEHYHFDFALSMIKLRGFGGKTEFWDHNLESFTLMAGLAAVTSRIQIYATAATLTLPPAIVARMAATIDSISGGRFGVNLVTGWQKPEYEQMGIWPGDDYFSRRYDYLTEYVRSRRICLTPELCCRACAAQCGTIIKRENHRSRRSHATSVSDESDPDKRPYRAG